MKVVALLFFVFIAPVVVFLATILYGGLSTQVIKEELAKSDVYEKILNAAKEPPSDENTYETQEDQIFSTLSAFITPNYLEKKVNGIIDDADSWISGKSATPPVLSFKDKINEIEITNPRLITQMIELSEEMKQVQPAEQETNTNNEQSKMLEEFIKNDFSIPLKDHFQGLKQTYQSLTVIYPILLSLLLLSLVGLYFWNHTWSARLRWFGITFFISGVWGYAFLAFVLFLVHSALRLFGGIKDDMFDQIAYPIFDRLLTFFVNHYVTIQSPIGIALIIFGALCFIFSFVVKAHTPLPKPKTPMRKK